MEQTESFPVWGHRMPSETEEIEPKGPVVVECGSVRIESPGGSGIGTKLFIDGVEQERLTHIVLRIGCDRVTKLELTRNIMPKGV